ncbi:hypothetical protein L1987_58617 [Smallanthus sonchifolius]|uniref:Uncharacterized protein n=1 Tax=Smallanthus sonchifolius TaxID=185202 RepID=A0ACB9DGK9_9ASTR|nr:hypothetical protein L1987_58617 [Smallanthus sonchifolius]
MRSPKDDDHVEILGATVCFNEQEQKSEFTFRSHFYVRATPEVKTIVSSQDDDLENRNELLIICVSAAMNELQPCAPISLKHKLAQELVRGLQTVSDSLLSWAMHQISSHLKTLKIMLPKITEGGSLSNIIDQCMYCAMGLGWVGLDFRGLLSPLFEE